MTRPLRTTLVLSTILILTFPAQAAVVYDPCFWLLDVRNGEVVKFLVEIESGGMVPTEDACVDRDPGSDDPPVGDPTGGAPVDEYLDLVTNVVYRDVGGTLQAVGYSSPALGYAVVHAYPPGAVPLPTTGDQGGACKAEYFCVSFNVALLGAHSVDVVGVYNDACQGTTKRLWSEPSPGAGTPVTAHRGMRLEPLPPDPCLTGTVAVFLIVDGSEDLKGVYYAGSVTNY